MSESKTSAISAPLIGCLRLPKALTKLLGVFFPPGVRLFGAGIQFLSTILIARHLGDAESAKFFFWSAVLTSFATVATFGQEHLVLRTVPRLKQSASRKALVEYLSTVRGITLALSLVIGAGLIIYAIVRGGNEGAQFSSWFLLLPVTLGAMALLIINGEALKGLSHPSAGVFFGHFVPVSLFFGLILLNVNHLNSPLLVSLYAAAYLVGLILTRLGPSKMMRERLLSVPKLKAVKSTLAEGFPIFSSNALGALCYVIPLAVLEFSRPAAEVSYLTTSFRISILLSVLATAIHGVFAPQLSCAAEIPGNIRGVFRVYAKSTLFTFSALAIPSFIGIIFPEWVMSIFGEGFRAGAATLRWLLVSCTLSMFIGPVYQLLIMTGNTKFLAGSAVVKLLVVSTLSLLLIPRIGGVGMVVAMAIAFLGEEIVGIFWVVRKLRREKLEAS